MDMHAGAGPVVMRLGHEGCFEIMRAGGGLDGALEQQASSAADSASAVLQVDLELPRPGFLHHSIDRQALRLGDPIDVIDERPERIHLLELESHRLFWIVTIGPAAFRA